MRALDAEGGAARGTDRTDHADRDEPAIGYVDERTPVDAGRAEPLEIETSRRSLDSTQPKSARWAAQKTGAPPEESVPPEKAGRARPGHPAESPLGFGRFVTIAALVILALIVWVVLF